jgi:hypothetical protein
MNSDFDMYVIYINEHIKGLFFGPKTKKHYILISYIDQVGHSIQYAQLFMYILRNKLKIVFVNIFKPDLSVKRCNAF